MFSSKQFEKANTKRTEKNKKKSPAFLMLTIFDSIMTLAAAQGKKRLKKIDGLSRSRNYDTKRRRGEAS